MEFQNRLYELRKKAGLSQEGLADLLGVTRQAVQKWRQIDPFLLRFGRQIQLQWLSLFFEGGI